MRILLILVPFLMAVGGLVFLQTSMFAPAAAPQSARASAPAPAPTPLVELSAITPVAAPLPGDTAPAPTNGAHGGAGDDADSELRSLTQDVLAGLGVSPPPGGANPAPAPAVDDKLHALTMAVLAGLSGAPDAAGDMQATPENEETHTLAQLVDQALSGGQSDAYLDELLNAAADAGQIIVPGALRTSEGRVDTEALLRALVVAGNGGQVAQMPADVIPSGRGVEVRVIQEAGATTPYYFYTVQQGDSLGAIAQNFYGDAGFYKVIFEANRRLLSTPDRIKSGQRLRIPTRG